MTEAKKINGCLICSPKISKSATICANHEFHVCLNGDEMVVTFYEDRDVNMNFSFSINYCPSCGRVLGESE